jgi:long-subunit fatty acid transport protein
MKKIIGLLVLSLSGGVFAAGGFEKPSLWSAKASALGGAYGSSVKGADSIFFNPAGLGGSQDFQLQTALIGGYVSGSVTQSNEMIKGDDSVMPTGGVFASKKINDKIAIGFGVYGIAGLDSRYNSVGYGSIDPDFAGYKRDYYSKLAVMEYSVGGSYAVSSNLKLGAAIRAQSVKSSFSQSSISVADGLTGYGIADGTPISVSNVELKNLKQNKFGSFKLGAQWESDSKNVGVGVTYRSQVDFTVKGQSGGDMVYTATGSALVSALTANAVNPVAGQVYGLDGSDTSVASTLPAQLTLDTHMKVSTADTVFIGYNFTQYSKNKELVITGSVVDTSLTATTTPITNTVLHWKDMHDFKVGYAHDVSETLQLRTGFAYTTPVTDKNLAGPTFCPPTGTKQVAVGFGKLLSLNGSNNISLDMTAEYYWSSASGAAPGSVDQNLRTPDINGTYAVKAWSLFTGVTFSY